MTGLRVPKLNNNDTSYILLEWLAEDGQAVRDGEPIVLLETSKAIEEVEAPADGVLRRLVSEGAECEPGQVIAHLLGAADEAAGATAQETPRGPDAPAPGGGASGVVVTAPARELIEAHGVAMERVYALGRKVIRRVDVEELLREDASAADDAPAAAAGPDGDDARWITLSRAQRRTAEVVERSLREIPAAFTAMNVDVTEVLSLARDLTRRLRALVGLPEMTVKALGGLLDRFPVFFAEPAPGLRARRADTADVGVTVDVGRGLFIPVVRDAGNRPLAEIARDLVRFRETALTGSFRERDLRGGAITLTLHTHDGIVFAVPIVFPGQTCALSLTAPRTEVVQDGSGFAVRKTATLGLAYDHRYINGRDAAEFLAELRTALESPARFLTENG
ncbi:dihydrolipoamide acetyltransferase component of pyruvate dehydrogenase complex [Microbispora rosea subsp. aerata]|nr:2-oxo acid dehydrogenase subunit E2 [Microbispora rosea]GGO23385.1 dihydrolipoamide acetyltransferase component of pyruvate dehydrogenase complex [Microbispora rosea subsp. aerata]GIH57761.1 dihydrolipoamide acetyltransferase component of pyruvate dehydrogenase complex [Microbispora rosea subsp. aerata]GLJ84128.1 dihydrolipoamide acetyltransferase component of pyruvate dehydrogenase complex [Microbispora rosea subsp. aerata]